MNHATDDQLVEAFYGSPEADVQSHLEFCTECIARLGELKHTLDALREYPVPERGQAYGEVVWDRLWPQIRAARPQNRRGWFKGFLLLPAAAVLLVITFLAGVWTEHERNGISSKARERVLLLALSDHLERSQIVLTELMHAKPGTLDLKEDQKRAHNLLDENRLLRQSAMRQDDRAHAALLDDLERVLLSLANGDSAGTSPEDLKLLQRRVEDDGLLWKVRITSANTRERGEKL